VRRVDNGLCPSGQSGASRAGLALGGAVIAAVLVLAGGALRSGGSPSPSASAGSGLGGGTETLGSLPPVTTPEPSIASSPAPPEATAIPGLRGQFVGALGVIEACPILYHRDGVFELILPDGYSSRIRRGRVEIVDAGGRVRASEGDLLGLNGNVREGGSFCMAGPQLHVSKIVEVVPRANA
jgi:hypothetical protein